MTCQNCRIECRRFGRRKDRLNQYTMRMGLRRFSRLTNAFSEKPGNHAAAVMLWFVFHNSCRIHRVLRETPATAAAIADHIWGLRDRIATLSLLSTGR